MILVVSSEGKWGTEFICQALSQNGLTTLAGDTSDFKDTLSIHDPALVVANLSGNQETDQEVCQELAIHSGAPILVIAACDDQEYELALFAAGVDDVLVRPIHTPLLIARIRSLLRRYGIPEEYCSTVYSVDDGTGFQAGNDGRSLTRFSLENIVMSNFLNKWIRKLHRWLVWPFILILLTAMLTRGTDFGSMIQKIQAPFMLILAFTGAYLWLLPYLSRWQRKKRQLTNAAKS